ncbi:hypothetical protein F511_19791 [Dorcoceras hygrometricum]|uniref:Uncharacterized protein n=1 Tax=Dorcoceras hygrometricum TaxID=472368 RepID=A0A2Z7AXA2_9LAMI|nr:hypothetical protein F511_19791 [Dorcoceras hygrometricum]
MRSVGCLLECKMSSFQISQKYNSRDGRMVTLLASRRLAPPVSRGNRHFTVGGGRLRQSGPRPEGRLLRQPALEGLTRSARMDSPRKVGITDSSCKNQLVVVSVQYGPFNPYIPIRSTTIGKSRVAKDPIAMHTSWRSNSDIASVTSIGYPRMSASDESSTTMHRLLHASRSHPIPPPNDPIANWMKCTSLNPELLVVTVHQIAGDLYMEGVDRAFTILLQHLENISPRFGGLEEGTRRSYSVLLVRISADWIFSSGFISELFGTLVVVIVAQKLRAVVNKALRAEQVWKDIEEERQLKRQYLQLRDQRQCKKPNLNPRRPQGQHPQLQRPPPTTALGIDNRHPCPKCHNNHISQWRSGRNVCFKCGAPGHLPRIVHG